jgi:hypothetical protein
MTYEEAPRDTGRIQRKANPADAIRLWSEVAAEQLAASGWANGCPVAAIALETASRSEQLAAACPSVFQSWRDALADAFENRASNDRMPTR